MAITISLINQKGGCGKSSSCFHLAGALAAEGLKVLLLDLDPQGSLSQGFLGPPLVESLSPKETIALLFDERSFFVDRGSLVRETDIEGISLCPANQHLATFNTPSPEETGMFQHVVRECVDEVGKTADIVLIDCPPNLYRCSWTAMVASDYVIIPVPPEDFGTQGLRAVHQCIEQARVLNPGLRRLGHLVTRYDRRLLVHRSYEARLRELYQRMVFSTVIPEASAFKVSLACRMPVEQYAPASAAAKATRDLVNEFMDRIDSKSTQRMVTNG